MGRNEEGVLLVTVYSRLRRVDVARFAVVSRGLLFLAMIYGTQDASSLVEEDPVNSSHPLCVLLLEMDQVSYNLTCHWADLS